MSEEILKALTQLFAIITKQDGGVTETERNFVISIFKEDLDQDSIKEYLALYDEFVGYGKEVEITKKKKLTSVKDSVRTLAICRKINKTLTQKQKVVVLIKLFELVSSDGNFTSQRMEIINTVAEVFNINSGEYKLIEGFIKYKINDILDLDDLLFAYKNPGHRLRRARELDVSITGQLIFLKIKSVDMYFVRYLGGEEIHLNGFAIKPKSTNQFSHGSTIKTPSGDALYYSDLIRHFLSEIETVNLSFVAKDLEKRFPNGAIGLRDINIYEGPGKLIGIMGASGAGKTTLLNVLAGIDCPTGGSIKINGVDLFSKETEKIKGVIGYISQDDLLIEELTVYENLYYNAKLCFANMNEEELDERVMATLSSLGLDQRKDLRVGSILDKTISGGQRKRLNIALELIREPAVMFVDEPTSGLSSRDSENVIDLLKELTLKGKLIFVVIHQPSSDIYKMFDKMMIMDVGGYPVYYGPPVEAVTYFKSASNQVGADKGQCQICGNVNPEQIFNIIEAKVVDEYGEFTNKRKVTPLQWKELYDENFNLEEIEEVKELPSRSLKIPSKIKQSFIFAKRDLLSKLSNKQYMLINLLEAPLLAFILAFLVRYKSGPDGQEYIFRFNENIPVYIMMAIIVALFMGLTVSAEEIIKDRKILKRESFLNLSWNSYLLSKVFILFVLSAIQTIVFAIIGNLILEIQGMTVTYWLILFSISCSANVIGLNISSAFNSAITVYILIPLLIIPQMVLSGLLFSFDKLNEVVSTKGKVPVVADLMVSRWGYEGVAVRQFMTNAYEAKFYSFEKDEFQADFKTSYWVKELKNRLNRAIEKYNTDNEDELDQVHRDLALVKKELVLEAGTDKVMDIDLNKALDPANFNDQIGNLLMAHLDGLFKKYQDDYNLAVQKKEKLIYGYENTFNYDLNTLKDQHYNESLTDLVRNLAVKDRIIEFKGNLLQIIDPVFNEPKNPKNLLDYRSHFFAPKKHFLGHYFDTYWFNLAVIWGMTILLYIALYFEWLRKLINSFEGLKRKNNSKDSN
ncbi:MAG: ATP-binding cassette domain-containing protein [Cytophagales bacterium]|nr:ATP-binding cassette domain-containing protein [Cytophagales bacterium]